jgi:urate oxidase
MAIQPTGAVDSGSAVLVSDTYGKTRVRVVKVTRSNGRHDLQEIGVNILFEGNFESCYRTGDNSRILPTDTMKNTVYALARDHATDPIEEFGQTLIQHFLTGNPQIEQIHVEIEQRPWDRIDTDGRPHPTAFRQAGAETRTAILTGTRESVQVSSGFNNLFVMKTAHSAFEGYIKDPLTTLRETSDRLFGTAVKAEWKYASDSAAPLNTGWNTAWNGIRRTILSTFADHHSLSVQHTLFATGEEVLARFPEVSEIHMKMPNKHCILVDLTPFGRDNPNEIFVPIEEPSGYIEATLRRA